MQPYDICFSKLVGLIKGIRDDVKLNSKFFALIKATEEMAKNDPALDKLCSAMEDFSSMHEKH